MPTVGWPAKGSSRPGVKIRIRPPPAVVDEDRLAEAELGGDPLALGLGHLPAVEEDAERVAPLAVLVDEDAEDVELGHVAILCRV